MKIRSFALGWALGIMGALYMLAVSYYPALSEMVFGFPKGLYLQDLMVDLYPYYDPTVWTGVLLGVVYGFLDFFVFGLVVGWLYNGCQCNCCGVKEVAKPAAKVAVKPAEKAAPKKKAVAKKKVVAKKKAAPKKKK